MHFNVLLSVVRHPSLQLVYLILHFINDSVVFVDVIVIDVDIDGAVFRVNTDLLGCIQSAATYYLVSGSDAKRDSRREGD